MCIAILSPKGTRITEEQFNNCWENNNNGAGFMYNDNDNKLHVVKEMDDCEKIYNKYKNKRNQFPNATFLIHFRISTHGVINRANCHPFKVSNKLGFIHNGQIKHVDDHDLYSDTNMFNRQILRKLPHVDIDYLNNPAVNSIMGNYIGYSKLVFMDNFGNTSIVNEDKGTWEDDGIWYSNDSHKSVKSYVDYGGTKVSKNSLRGGSSYGYGSGYDSKYSYYGNGGGYHSWSWNRMGDSSIGYKNEDEEVVTTEKTDDKGYKISNGMDCCSSCGIQLLDNEVISEKGECLECVSQEKSASIIASAVADGCILNDVCGTSIIGDKV